MACVCSRCSFLIKITLWIFFLCVFPMCCVISEKRDSELRKCFHKIGLWPDCGAFSFLVIDVGGPTSHIWAGGTGCYKRAGCKSHGEQSQWAVLLHGFSSSSCFKVLPWVPSLTPFLMTCDWGMQAETMSPKLLLVLVFITAMEILRYQESNIPFRSQESYRRSCQEELY